MSIFSKRGQTAPAEAPKSEMHPDVKAAFKALIESMTSLAATQITLQQQIDQLKKGALAQQEMIQSLASVINEGNR